MGARGVTEEMVRAAVAQLEREERPVSLKTVRAQIGRGSNSTLLRHLSCVAPRLGERRRTPPPSRTVRAELDALMRRVWSTACVDAARTEAAAFAARAASLEAQRVRIGAEVEALRGDMNRLLRRLDRAEQQLRRLARQLADGPPPAGAVEAAPAAQHAQQG